RLGARDADGRAGRGGAAVGDDADERRRELPGPRHQRSAHRRRRGGPDREEAAAVMTEPILQARGLVKRYGRVTAIDGADFDLLPGEVLAVVGDNGAGKSSLIKALSGALIPDAGEIKVDGETVHFRSPLDARRAGIETVYQDLALAPAL